MTMTTLSGNDLVTALRWVVKGRSVEFAAQAVGADVDVIRERATAFGYPALARLSWAVAELEAGRDPAQAAPSWDRDHLPALGLQSLPVDQLSPSVNNPRERLTDIEDLAASIRESGLIQPLVAQPDGAGRYVIVAGHRRHAAVQRLGWREVEVIVRKPMLPDDELVTMLVENGQRAGLDPIEEARAMKRLAVSGLTQQEIAHRVGRSLILVGRRLSLLSLSAAEQEKVRNGEATLGASVEKAKVDSGRIRKPQSAPSSTGWHFSFQHDLVNHAAARCNRLKHSRSRRLTGGSACGECWESVIRADERQATAAKAASGKCPTCDQPTPAGAQR